MTYPVTSDPARGATPVPDLATDTGTASEHGETWTFTLKKGVRWQDGKPVTCADLAYGVVAKVRDQRDHRRPGLRAVLPRHAAGRPGAAALRRALREPPRGRLPRAVTCSPDDRTITYRFNRPWPDFPLAVASLLAFDPYRRDQDRGGKSLTSVFSTGPYRLQGDWSRAAAAPSCATSSGRCGDGPGPQGAAGEDHVPAGSRRTVPHRAAGRGHGRRPGGRHRLAGRALAVRRGHGPGGRPCARDGHAVRLYLVRTSTGSPTVRVRRALVLAADTQGYRTAIGGTRRPAGRCRW